MSSMRRSIERGIKKKYGMLATRRHGGSKSRPGRGFKKTPLLSTIYKHVWDTYRYVEAGYHHVAPIVNPRRRRLFGRSK